MSIGASGSERQRLARPMAPDFVPGLTLSRDFYVEVVAPLLTGTRHSAARLGEGSDVLGFDTPRSTDHGWGPRLQLFVEPGQVDAVAATVDEGLPGSFRGWPVRFGWDDVPVSHHVEVDAIDGWLERRLGLGRPDGLGPIDWLATPQQLLLEATAGEVFHDGLDELAEIRAGLAWYPDDVWMWLLACQWQRIGQEEAFVGRTAEIGDELGSRLVAGRLVRDLVRLCFLLERRYAPYTKWLGSAFAQLDAAAGIGSALERVLDAGDYPARERALTEAYEAVGAHHNRFAPTDHVDPTVRPYYGRPFLVIEAGRFVDACRARVHDPFLRELPLVGGVDQLADSTDMATPDGARRARALFAGVR
jgi:Domain of unknown function (DUF4037)